MDVEEIAINADNDVEMSDDNLNNDDDAGFNDNLDNYLRGDGPPDDEDCDDPEFSEKLQKVNQKLANSSSGFGKILHTLAATLTRSHCAIKEELTLQIHRTNQAEVDTNHRHRSGRLVTYELVSRSLDTTTKIRHRRSMSRSVRNRRKFVQLQNTMDITKQTNCPTKSHHSWKSLQQKPKEFQKQKKENV